MEEDGEDLAEIDANGDAHPVGNAAALRMQSRTGRFHVLPSPPDLLLMRKAEGEKAARACLLSGEVRSGGALCDIVSFVAQSGWKGELVVFDRTVSRSIYFDQGHVAGAESSAPGDRLGEVLFRYGILTKAQQEVCSEATGTGITRYGEAAVRFGFVTREKLFSLMSRQTEEIFYGIVLMGSGTFYFLESFEEAVLSSRQRLSVASLIREGVRRMHETRSFRARIASDRHVPVLVGQSSPPESDLRSVYDAVDGARSVGDLCRLLGQGEFEVSRSLFQLIQSGRVSVRPPQLSPADMIDVCNQALALILRELDARSQGDLVRGELAEFVRKESVYPPLFEGAGPSDDGTFDAGAIAANLRKLGEPADDTVARWLHEYASYALFLAKPHLHRARMAEGGATGATKAAPSKRRLSQRIATILEPIAPAGPPGDAPHPSKKATR